MVTNNHECLQSSKAGALILKEINFVKIRVNLWLL
jgi:hypothetical protein